MQSAFVQLVKRVLNAVENYKEKSTGRMVADLFLVVPSPDEYPDYYVMIKKPIAIADMQKKNKMGIYTSYADVIADFKLMLENAATYNMKGSQVVKDAKILMQTAENLLKKELEGTVWDPATHHPQSSSGVSSPTPSTPATPNSSRQPAPKKPSPDELRNIIKKLTSYKNSEGRAICEIFLTLPNANDYPDYYVEIKKPIAIDMIKKKVSQREYTSMNQFESDLSLMFDNAHQFNEEGSIVYEDATELQAVFMHAIGKGPPPNSKPAPTEGRSSLPEAEHNGQTFAVGQCVHVKNYIDPSKPIICQITEMYKKKDGKIYLQGAWYLRPENTVHRSSQKFMEFEVFKTTHMEEYYLTDVQDTCYVLFVKDYVRGRPRNLRPGQSVYVCESRYNEQREHMQKIKQWKDSIKIDLEIYTTPIVPKRVKSLFATDEVSPGRRKGSEDVDISDSDTPAAPTSGTKRRRSVSPKPLPAGASVKKVAAIPGSTKAHSSSTTSSTAHQAPASTPAPVPKAQPSAPTPAPAIPDSPAPTPATANSGIPSDLDMLAVSTASKFDALEVQNDRILKWFSAPPLIVSDHDPVTMVPSLDYLYHKHTQAQVSRPATKRHRENDEPVDKEPQQVKRRRMVDIAPKDADMLDASEASVVSSQKDWEPVTDVLHALADVWLQETWLIPTMCETWTL